jgi:hypothetical protein
MSKMTVYFKDTGLPVEVDSADLVRKTDGSLGVHRERLAARGEIIAPTPSTDDGPSVSIRLVKLEGRLSRFEERVAGVEGQLTRLAERVARLDERLVGVERRLDSEAAREVKTIVRDERGRITGLLSEPAVTKHQPLVRNQ